MYSDTTTAYAASTFDFGLMMDAFSTLGLKLKRENVSEDMEGVRFLLRDMAPRYVQAISWFQ